VSTTTTASRLQLLLEALAATQANPEPRTQPGRHPTTAVFVTVVTESRTTGWDPREVWLTRVHAPRQGRRWDW
jgi:hypothetical protein